MPVRTLIAIFDTTYETLRAEDYFREEGVVFRPVLKPRKIGSACRMALQFGEEYLPSAKGAVAKGKLALKAFYWKDGEQWQKLD